MSTHGAQEPPNYLWALAFIVGSTIVSIAVFGLDTVDNVMIIVLEVVFIIFFARHLIFAVSGMRTAVIDVDLPSRPPANLPKVTVIVACKNEESVVDGMIACLLRFEYPSERLQVIIIDDGSDDDTPAKLDGWAQRHSNLLIIHRPPGAGGGKSGGLNEGLAVATGEVIIVFDADHQPLPDVVWRLARHFNDPGVGAVQGRCVIRNPDDTPLSRLVAIDYLAGYLVNEYGRQSIYRLPAYGGANCAVRASSVRELGGWNPNTVTEDTDLTLQLILRGQRVRYDVTAIDTEEGVVTLKRFWKQRYRWSRGHQQIWREYRGRVWHSDRLSKVEKLETIMFLLVFHMPVLSAVGLLLLIPWFLGLTHPADPLNAYLLWTLLFLGPLMELGAGLLCADAPRKWVRSLLFFLPLFFVSVALCSKSWLDGMLGRPYVWVKTSRAGDESAAPEDPASPTAAVA